MDLKEHINYWLKSADEDLDSALVNLKNNKYNWALFIGHLVIEKALKAYYVKTSNNSLPPRIHDLIKLAKISNLSLDEKLEEFLFTLNQFNLEARYPDYKEKTSKVATVEFTKDILNKITEVYKWIKSQII